VAITLSCSRDLDGSTTRLRWQVRDITQQKQAEAKIHHQAFYDALTGLPNRALLDTYLPKVLAQAKRHETQLAVAFLDLDQFKGINDSLGHGVGDELLQQVGQRLQSCLREADLLVRWGGDEFIVILADVTKLKDVGRTCDRIIASLQPVFIIKDHNLYISISFGVALFPRDGNDPETLLRHADQALYKAKSQGCNTYRFYSY
jgi:diguanylate cyclase (GGDEF)-like protein